MKRIFTLFLILSFALFPSCREKESHWQPHYPYMVTGELSTSLATVSIAATVTDEKTVNMVIESPQNLVGYGFKVNGDKIGVYYEGMEIEMPKDITLPAKDLAEMLSVNGDAYSCSRKEEGERLDCFLTESASITVYTKKDSDHPHLIKYFGDIDISFKISSYSAEK